MPDAPLENHAVVAGFGVPGRAAADWLADHHIHYCVIELNANTVARCGKVGVPIIEGDVCQESTLRAAGMEKATIFIIAVPNDKSVIEAVRIARQINPSVRILARCAFFSSGLEATRRGANEIVVAEQVVANELVRLLERGSA